MLEFLSTKLFIFLLAKAYFFLSALTSLLNIVFSFLLASTFYFLSILIALLATVFHFLLFLIFYSLLAFLFIPNYFIRSINNFKDLKI